MKKTDTKRHIDTQTGYQRDILTTSETGANGLKSDTGIDTICPLRRRLRKRNSTMVRDARHWERYRYVVSRKEIQRQK